MGGRDVSERESLISARESVDATHDWIREHVGDHAYAHGLADDVVSLLRLLTRAADALHDAAWVMEGAKPSPPLPPPVTFVLPQTKALEAEIRAVLADE